MPQADPFESHGAVRGPVDGRRKAGETDLQASRRGGAFDQGPAIGQLEGGRFLRGLARQFHLSFTDQRDGCLGNDDPSPEGLQADQAVRCAQRRSLGDPFPFSLLGVEAKQEAIDFINDADRAGRNGTGRRGCPWLILGLAGVVRRLRRCCFRARGRLGLGLFHGDSRVFGISGGGCPGDGFRGRGLRVPSGEIRRDWLGGALGARGGSCRGLLRNLGGRR